MKVTTISIIPLSFLFCLRVLVAPTQAQTAATTGLRGLAELDPSCAVTDFTFYEFDTNRNAQPVVLITSVLDMTDYNLKKINIGAEITAGCQPRCVKLSFAGRQKKERNQPYVLYGDNKGKIKKGRPRQSGDQDLEACLYTDRNCTLGEQGCKTKALYVIPADEPLSGGPFKLKTFKVTFAGTAGPATQLQTTAAATAICDVIDSYFISGAFYKSDVAVKDFVCSGTAVVAADNASPLTITVDTTASVTKSTGFNPYVNSNLPDANLLYTKMTDLLRNNGTIGPNAPAAVELFVTNLNASTNPYSSVTSFTIA